MTAEPPAFTAAALRELVAADPLLALLAARRDLAGLEPRRGRESQADYWRWQARELCRVVLFSLSWREVETSRRRLRLAYAELLAVAAPGHEWPAPHELEPDRAALDELAARFG